MLVDLQRPYPSRASVRDGLRAYLDENGFDPAEYDSKSVRVEFWGVPLRIPNPPGRKKAVRFHDLHHVATGYGTDPCGEAEISAWELRRGLKGLTLYVRAIVVSGALFGLVHSPVRTIAAWRRADRASGTLFDGSMDDYARYLDMSVGELRDHLRLPEGGLGDARRLHSGAPRHISTKGMSRRKC